MIPINASGNCTTDLIGSGSRGCDIQSFGDLLGINLHPKGWSMNVQDDSLTIATWKEEIKDFNVIPYLGVYDFTQDTPDNENATSSTGVLSPIRVGKPQFSFSFDKGGCFHKSLFDKRGKNRWDISLVFETGILFATNNGETEISGFNAGLFDVGTFRLLQGTDPQQSTAMFQLIDSYQFNTQFTFVTWEELGGVNLSTVEGVVELRIGFDPQPEVGDTELVFSLSAACNYSDTIIGFDSATLYRLGGVNSSTLGTVTYDADTQLYTATITGALADGDTVQLIISEDGEDVIEDESGTLYKGKSALVTITEPTT